MDYYDLSIRVRNDGTISASSDLGGEVFSKLNLDLEEIDLALQLIEEDKTNENLLKKVGKALYNALFEKEISAYFASMKTSAGQKECGVRLRLIFEKPEMATIPWEFLYDGRTDTFLANDSTTALSRYIDSSLRTQEIKPASLPLKMLLVISSPKNLDLLDSVGEETLIKEALQDHIKSGQIEIDVLTKATVIDINQKLDEKSYNVLHFIGHGVFENGKGHIALMDENGHSKFLDDQHFANLFLGKRGMGLVVLNSCEGTATSSSQVFAGMAPRLVQKGIPAVIAMQYPIRDSTAKLFADKFYRSLALAQPVDEAVQSTRNLISIEVGLDKRDFATPVLFMRAKDGIILDLTSIAIGKDSQANNEKRAAKNHSETLQAIDFSQIVAGDSVAIGGDVHSSYIYISDRNHSGKQPLDDTDTKIIKTMATLGIGFIRITDINAQLIPPIDDIELFDRLVWLERNTRFVIVHKELRTLADSFPQIVELTSEGRLFAKGIK